MGVGIGVDVGIDVSRRQCVLGPMDPISNRGVGNSCDKGNPITFQSRSRADNNNNGNNDEAALVARGGGETQSPVILQRAPATRRTKGPLRSVVANSLNQRPMTC